MQDKLDKKYMERCLFLAKKGLGLTKTNPMTGTVIVHNNKIISEGWHNKKRIYHAERIAIDKVKNKNILKESTLYTNLEPCFHHGCTPPCVDLIIKYKIPRIVIGTKDPFVKVNNRSINKLLKKGHKVSLNILKEKCEDLNKRFFNFHMKKRPYIIIKWAETKDGIISKKDKPLKISNKYSQVINHKWRSEECSIMLGTKSILTDNPRLNVRNFIGKDPFIIIIDKNLTITKDKNIFSNKQTKIIFNNKKSLTKDNLIYEKIDFSKNTIYQILDRLYNKNILSVIVEGGSNTIQRFLDDNIWDEARVFISSKLAKEGVKSPCLKNHDKIYSKKIFDDKLIVYKRKR